MAQPLHRLCELADGPSPPWPPGDLERAIRFQRHVLRSPLARVVELLHDGLYFDARKLTVKLIVRWEERRRQVHQRSPTPLTHQAVLLHNAATDLCRLRSWERRQARLAEAMTALMPFAEEDGHV